MPPPKPAPPKPYSLTFAKNSIRNTTVSLPNDKFYYEIVTRFWHPHLTKINKFNMEDRQIICAAEIEAVPGQDVRVRFNTTDVTKVGGMGGEGEWMSASEFVKADADSIGGTFTAGDGLEYRWMMNKGYLQLVKADDASETPVATYHPHRRHFLVFRMAKRASMDVMPDAAAALEKIIVSYILVERRRRNAKNKLIRYAALEKLPVSR